MGWLKRFGAMLLGFGREAITWILPLLKKILTDEMSVVREVAKDAVLQVAKSNPSGGKPLDLLQQALVIIVPKLLASGIQVAVNDIIAIVTVTIANSPDLSKSNGNIN